MTILIAVIHAGLAAAWVGGMAYSLLVVQPKLQKFFGPEEDSRKALTAVIPNRHRAHFPLSTRGNDTPADDT
jgi:hypothetical protein